MGGPSLLERLGLGAVLGRGHLEREQARETSRRLVETTGKSTLDELVARLDNPSFYESRSDSPYAFVLYWDFQTTNQQKTAPKGLMLTVLNEEVKVVYSVGFGLWRLLEHSSRYQEFLRQQQEQDSNISLATKINLAAGYAVKNVGQDPTHIKIEDGMMVMNLHLHEIGSPQRIAA